MSNPNDLNNAINHAPQEAASITDSIGNTPQYGYASGYLRANALQMAVDAIKAYPITGDTSPARVVEMAKAFHAFLTEGK